MPQDCQLSRFRRFHPEISFLCHVSRFYTNLIALVFSVSLQFTRFRPPFHTISNTHVNVFSVFLLRSMNFLFMLTVAMARSSSGVNVIRYTLPVLWMTSRCNNAVHAKPVRNARMTGINARRGEVCSLADCITHH